MLVGTILAVSLGEVVLRIVYRHDFVPPSHRNWRLRKVWDLQFGRLNALGFRDRERESYKREGVFRIVAIGDSLTYGVGVEDPDDRYTALLEQRLNQSGTHRVEVLNFAKRGWNVAEYTRAVETLTPAFAPDLILIGFFMNDVELDRSRRPTPLYLLPKPVHSVLLRASYLYALLYSRLDSLANRERYLAYRVTFTEVTSPDWQDFEPRWRRLLQMSRQQAEEVVVVILPLLAQLDDEHPFLSLYQRVEVLSRAEGAAVVQLFPSVAGEREEDLWVGFSDAHPNERAHRLFSDALATFLLARSRS